MKLPFGTVWGIPTLVLAAAAVFVMVRKRGSVNVNQSSPPAGSEAVNVNAETVNVNMVR